MADHAQQEFEYNLRKYTPQHARLRAIRAFRKLLRNRAEAAKQEITPELGRLRRSVYAIVLNGVDAKP